jgi:outer membrane protein insertion porin family/translocation and assembly module TamA
VEWAGPTAICSEPDVCSISAAESPRWGSELPPTGTGEFDLFRPRRRHDRLLQLNYNVTASVRQPRFVSPIIAGTFALFAERRSEFEVYRREEIGLSATLLREDYHRVPITVGYKLSYGRTTASAASFCAFFNACTPQDAQRLSERRVLGIFGAGIAWPRSNNPLDPTRGHVY